VQDITSLFLSLANFSISCYPDRLDYMDQILLFTKESIFNTYAPELHTKQSEANILQLLLLPAKTWDVLTLITTLKYYQPLLAMQPYTTRRTTALTILDNILGKETRIDQPEQVYQVLEICHVLIKDKTKTQQLYQQYEDEDDRDEQGWVARLVHLFYSDDEDVQFLLLSAARQQLEQGEAQRIKTIFPSLIVSSLKLATRYYNKQVKMKQEDNGKTEVLHNTTSDSGEPNCDNDSDADDSSDQALTSQAAADEYPIDEDHINEDHIDEDPTDQALTDQTRTEQDIDWTKKMTTLFRFIHQIIKILYRQGENTESVCVQFSLMAGQNADYCGFSEVAYNFFLDAFRIYEESVSHSKAQFNAIVYTIGSLLCTSPQLLQYYTTLSTKITLLSTKLLKKPDQSRAVYTCSHLWTQEAPARVIECLQKSLKIADSCMDTVTNEILFLEILNQYMYYYEKGQELASTIHHS
jgi:vacuolar protein sorting-associated protein 35